MELLSFPLLPTFLVLFLFIVVMKGKRLNTRNRKSKLPPGPSKLPVIGSAHHLTGLPHHSLSNLAKKHGPLMYLELGQMSVLVVTSPKMAKEVMKTHDLLFANRFVVFSTKLLTYDCKDMAFAPYGGYWRQLRKICMSELLSAKRVQSFEPVREEAAYDLIQTISSMDGSIVNLSEKIYSSSNDVISKVVFRKRYNDKKEFSLVVREVIELSAGFSVADLFPSLTFLHVISGLKAKLEKVHKKLDRIFEDIIEEHREKRRTNKLKKDDHEEDLVDVLLRLQEDTGLEFPITDDNIKALVMDILLAGSETSSSTMEWAMSELLRNPRVMEKVQAEVRKAFEGKRNIKEEDIAELSYLRSVIKETLRLHPPVPLLLPRECRERCEIDGYEIPANIKVMINVWAIGRDPEHWSDPEKFYLERFNGSSFDYKGTNFEFLPFGAGRRMCPGILFAVANIELILAHLLYHFDWKLPNGVKPKELDMTETIGSTVRRKNELYAIATPYTPHVCRVRLK